MQDDDDDDVDSAVNDNVDDDYMFRTLFSTKTPSEHIWSASVL